MQFLANCFSTFPICLPNTTSCSPTSCIANSPIKFALSVLSPTSPRQLSYLEQPLYSTSPSFLSRGLLFPSAGCQGKAHFLAWPPNRCLPASLPPFPFSQAITCQGLVLAAPPVHCLALLRLESFLAASSEVPQSAALLCFLPAASPSCLQLSSLPPASPPLGLRAASSSRPCQLLYSPFLRLLPLLPFPALPLSRSGFLYSAPTCCGPVLLTCGTTSPDLQWVRVSTGQNTSGKWAFSSSSCI